MEPRFHQGDATVHASGDVYRCRANLRCWTDPDSHGTSPYPGLEQWAGRLHFDSETAAETVLYAAAPYLVLGDTASTFSVEALDRPTATLTIHGTGPAPL
ncbi:hypothetical protein [Kitasatospora arboriphila]|uniref:Uncharacterized protein n=1 Tax=Kitasatospora arboriphila TaxID=258052 RepID=A0ABN1U7F7_9ACTN